MEKKHLESKNGVHVTITTGKETINKRLLNKLLQYCGVEGGKVVRTPEVKVP
jgi:hypothetical protein